MYLAGVCVKQTQEHLPKNTSLASEHTTPRRFLRDRGGLVKFHLQSKISIKFLA